MEVSLARLIKSIEDGVPGSAVAEPIAKITEKIAGLDDEIKFGEQKAGRLRQIQQERALYDQKGEEFAQGRLEMSEEKPDRSVFQLLRVEVRLERDEEGSEWANVMAVIGDDRLPIFSNITTRAGYRNMGYRLVDTINDYLEQRQQAAVSGLSCRIPKSTLYFYKMPIDHLDSTPYAEAHSQSSRHSTSESRILTVC